MEEFECVFHSDKLRFKKIERGIQKARIIPRPYVYRLGNAVCSCKRKKISFTDLESNNGYSISLHTSYAIVIELIDKYPDKLGTLRTYLSHIGNMGGLRTENYSLFLLLYILYQSHINKDYRLLNNHKARVKDEGQAETCKMQSNYEKPIRKNNTRIQELNNERKAKLQIFPRNLKKLRVSPEMEKIIHEFKPDILLKFDNEENIRRMCSYSKKSVVICHYSDPCEHKLEEFLKVLKDLAIKIQRQCREEEMLMVALARAEHRKWLRTYYFQLDAYREEYSYAEYLSLVSAHDLKENFSCDFTEKQRCKKWDRKRIVPSPFEGGHCFNCLKPYEKLSIRSLFHDDDNDDDDDDNEEEEEEEEEESDDDVGRHTGDMRSFYQEHRCLHHPGFINLDHHWTCCNIHAEENKPSYQEHSSTGCSFLPRHRWRCHKKPDRKLMGCNNRKCTEALNEAVSPL